MASSETKILPDCLGRGLNLTDAAEYSTDAIVSKTLLNKVVGAMTLFAFDQGQSLSEHASPYDAVVQVLEGRANLTIGGQQ
jgi:quercetin dioxygenase-like cupin family protein